MFTVKHGQSDKFGDFVKRVTVNSKVSQTYFTGNPRIPENTVSISMVPGLTWGYYNIYIAYFRAYQAIILKTF